MFDSRVLIVPLAAIALPVVLVPMVMALRQAQKKREFEHLERMRSMETGQPIPGHTNWVGGMVCAAIGAGVPIAAFLFTMIAYLNTRNAPSEMWLAPVGATFLAICGAGTIAAKVFPSAKAPTVESPLGKPAYDPDAYETVGR